MSEALDFQAFFFLTGWCEVKAYFSPCNNNNKKKQKQRSGELAWNVTVHLSLSFLAFVILESRTLQAGVWRRRRGAIKNFFFSLSLSTKKRATFLGREGRGKWMLMNPFFFSEKKNFFFPPPPLTPPILLCPWGKVLGGGWRRRLGRFNNISSFVASFSFHKKRRSCWSGGGGEERGHSRKTSGSLRERKEMLLFFPYLISEIIIIKKSKANFD